MRPALFSAFVYFVGSPAEVVTKRTPCAITKSTIFGSRTKACAMFTPKGLSVRSRILQISSRTVSSSPDEVSMIPSPPALDTAEASCARAIQPIGACTIGYSTPSSSVTRLRILMVGRLPDPPGVPQAPRTRQRCLQWLVRKRVLLRRVEVPPLGREPDEACIRHRRLEPPRLDPPLTRQRLLAMGSLAEVVVGGREQHRSSSLVHDPHVHGRPTAVFGADLRIRHIAG